MGSLPAVKAKFLALRAWAQHHGGEVLWAAVFAVFFGVPLAVLAAMLFLEPPSYTVYLVSEKEHLVHTLTPEGGGRDTDTKYQFEHADEFNGLKLDGSDVKLKVIELNDNSREAATQMANQLIHQRDTLLVIGHQDSGPTEASLATYLNERPQVPFIASIQTDDDLLRNACKQPTDCYDGVDPLPYLQLSPTNREQAHWALQFADQKRKEHFLIIESTALSNHTYSESLAIDYEKAIAELIERNRRVTKQGPKKDLSRDQLAEELRENDIDCVLYAGGYDDAIPLLKEIVEIQGDQKGNEKSESADKGLMVILDDDVVEERLKSADIKLKRVNITDESDAEDYKRNVSVPGFDAIAIAAELVNDLNSRREMFDFRYRVKALFRQQEGADARRALVQVMQDNFRYRSAYFGAMATATAGRRTVYAFDDQHKRSNGLFHVWERRGPETVDVDKWHPPKASSESAGDCDQTDLKAVSSQASIPSQVK